MGGSSPKWKPSIPRSSKDIFHIKNQFEAKKTNLSAENSNTKGKLGPIGAGEACHKTGIMIGQKPNFYLNPSISSQPASSRGPGLDSQDSSSYDVGHTVANGRIRESHVTTEPNGSH